MWDERYATAKGYLFGTEPAGFLRDQPNFLTPGAKALAVADGEGRNSVYLAGLGLEVTAMDASGVALGKARDLAARRGAKVDFQQADIADWDWQEDAYDLVVAIFIQFMGPEMRDRVFEGMQRTLKPGGVVMLHGYTPKQLDYGTGGPGRLENLYSEEMLAGRFADFEILRLAAYERHVDEGHGHSGQSALIDLIARKPGE